MHHERFAVRGIKSGLNKDSLFNSINQYGVLNYLMIGDKVVAGTIGSVYNNQFCLHVIAHDNNYNEYNLGNVILLKTIEYAINCEIHIFNFLWGYCEYKTRFGAKESLFYDYYVYRGKHFKYYLHKTDMFLRNNIKKMKNMIKAIFPHPYRAAKWMYHRIWLREGS